MHRHLIELNRAFRSPTLKQKEAYGRFCHTLSAASLIGAATLFFTESQASYVFRESIMILTGVLLFAVGAVFCQGTDHGLGYRWLFDHCRTNHHLGRLGLRPRRNQKNWPEGRWFG